jgi:hypothetical protein
MSGFVFMRATSLFIRPTLACISEKIFASEPSSSTLPSSFSSFVIASAEITVEATGAVAARGLPLSLYIEYLFKNETVGYRNSSGPKAEFFFSLARA